MAQVRLPTVVTDDRYGGCHMSCSFSIWTPIQERTSQNRSSGIVQKMVHMDSIKLRELSKVLRLCSRRSAATMFWVVLRRFTEDPRCRETVLDTNGVPAGRSPHPVPRVAGVVPSFVCPEEVAGLVGRVSAPLIMSCFT